MQKTANWPFFFIKERKTQLDKCACNCQNFGVVAFHLTQSCWYRDLNPCSSGVAIVLYQNNIVRIKAWGHALSRHFVSNDERFFFLPFNGQEHSVTDFSDTVLSVDMYHPRRAVIWRISEGTVVYHPHSGHFLNCSCSCRDTVQNQKKKTYKELSKASSTTFKCSPPWLF